MSQERRNMEHKTAVLLLLETSYDNRKAGDVLKVPTARARVWIERNYARLATNNEQAAARIARRNHSGLADYELSWLAQDAAL